MNAKLGMAQTIDHIRIGRRGIWLYNVPTQLFDLVVVEYEDEGLGLQEAYIGLDDEEAKQIFKRVAKKILEEMK